MSKPTPEPERRPWSVDDEVRERYARGAAQREDALCCPTDYDPAYLKVLPEEILEKDYGCGDPSRYVGEGETVLDLGSGAGKICYILSQKVGPEGRSIGIDFNDAMLEVARRWQPEMASRIGWNNVEFRKGRIQDLALDLERAQTWLEENPIRRVEDQDAWREACQRLRRQEPLIPDGSVDVVVSNCVLNLVETGAKEKLFREIHRVLRRGGRAVISDIVCDEPPTEEMRRDPELWSGCISGAFTEDGFLRRFEDAGLYGVEILDRGEEPWRVVQGIEFRSMTVRAWKGKEGPCLERRQAVVYRGPHREVRDDDGHVFPRGVRIAVCDKTFRILTDPKGPYAGMFVGVEPREEVPLDQAGPFACRGTTVRSPGETKGRDYRATTEGSDCC